MIDYTLLDELYENVPTKQTIRPSSDPVGSLTANRRKVKPNRDGAHKRVTEWRYHPRMYKYLTQTEWAE